MSSWLQADKDWSLFCPHECPGLGNCWGEEFNELYERYESEGRQRRTIKAQKLVRGGWLAGLLMMGLSDGERCCPSSMGTGPD